MLYLSGNKKSLYSFFLIPPMPDKTARLLEYLAALTKLGSKTFYSLDEYESAKIRAEDAPEFFEDVFVHTSLSGKKMPCVR
jgi:hypothetical protein